MLKQLNRYMMNLPSEIVTALNESKGDDPAVKCIAEYRSTSNKSTLALSPHSNQIIAQAGWWPSQVEKFNQFKMSLIGFDVSPRWAGARAGWVGGRVGGWWGVPCSASKKKGPQVG